MRGWWVLLRTRGPGCVVDGSLEKVAYLFGSQGDGVSWLLNLCFFEGDGILLNATTDEEAVAEGAKVLAELRVDGVE